MSKAPEKSTMRKKKIELGTIEVFGDLGSSTGDESLCKMGSKSSEQ